MEHAVFQKIDRAPKPDFSQILSKSFDLFKNVWVDGLVHGLISMAIVLPLIVIIYLPFIPMYLAMLNGNRYPYDYGYEPFMGFSLLAIVGYVLLVMVLILILQVLVFSINAHFYKVLRIKDTGTSEDAGGYFVYLKGNFTKIFLLNLATFGIALLAVLLCYLPIFYVMVPLQLITVMFTFNRDMSVTDIIKACFKLGNKFWLIIFGLIILSSMIAQVGIILCLVGVMITAYFVHIPMYYVYKDTIGFEDNDSAGSHLI
jgi:hypothetical protein